MRLSISSWATAESDVDRSVAAIVVRRRLRRAHHQPFDVTRAHANRMLHIATLNNHCKIFRTREHEMSPGIAITVDK